MGFMPDDGVRKRNERLRRNKELKRVIERADKKRKENRDG